MARAVAVARIVVREDRHVETVSQVLRVRVEGGQVLGVAVTGQYDAVNAVCGGAVLVYACGPVERQHELAVDVETVDGAHKAVVRLCGPVGRPRTRRRLEEHTVPGHLTEFAQAVHVRAALL